MNHVIMLEGPVHPVITRVMGHSLKRLEEFAITIPSLQSIGAIAGDLVSVASHWREFVGNSIH